MESEGGGGGWQIFVDEILRDLPFHFFSSIDFLIVCRVMKLKHLTAD